RGLPPLPVASGIRAKGPRLLQIISWRHRERAADFPAAARLLPGAPATSRNQASLVVRVSLPEWNSRDRPCPQRAPFRGSAAPSCRDLLLRAISRMARL